MGFLEYRFKLPIHMIELVLIHVALGVSAVRLFMPNVPRTRATTMALGFSAKSLIFIFYQLLTSHIQRFQRWRSYKAYTIINGMEVVFWVALCYLNAQANMRQCDGTGCILSWVVFGTAVTLTILSLWAFGICFVYFKQVKQMKAAQQQSAPAAEMHLGYGGHSITMETTQWSSNSSVERFRKELQMLERV